MPGVASRERSTLHHVLQPFREWALRPNDHLFSRPIETDAVSAVMAASVVSEIIRPHAPGVVEVGRIDPAGERATA